MLKQITGFLLSFIGFILLVVSVLTPNKSVFQVASVFSIPSIAVGIALLMR